MNGDFSEMGKLLILCGIGAIVAGGPGVAAVLLAVLLKRMFAK